MLFFFVVPGIYARHRGGSRKKKEKPDLVPALKEGTV